MPSGLTGLRFCFCVSGNAVTVSSFVGGGGGGGMLWPSWVCRVSRGCCICLVSCSNSSIRRWLTRRSATTSFILACIAFTVPGGLLSASPGGSCILGGLALLLLVFRVDTISNGEISYICTGTVVPTDGAN